jgi:hypothetical protein
LYNTYGTHMQCDQSGLEAINCFNGESLLNNCDDRPLVNGAVRLLIANRQLVPFIVNAICHQLLIPVKPFSYKNSHGTHRHRFAYPTACRDMCLDIGLLRQLQVFPFSRSPALGEGIPSGVIPHPIAEIAGTVVPLGRPHPHLRSLTSCFRLHATHASRRCPMRPCI